MCQQIHTKIFAFNILLAVKKMYKRLLNFMYDKKILCNQQFRFKLKKLKTASKALSLFKFKANKIQFEFNVALTAFTSKF